jgi:hypothetical protein
MHIAKALADLHGVYVIVCILFEVKVYTFLACAYIDMFVQRICFPKDSPHWKHTIMSYWTLWSSADL